MTEELLTILERNCQKRKITVEKLSMYYKEGNDPWIIDKLIKVGGFRHNWLYGFKVFPPTRLNALLTRISIIYNENGLSSLHITLLHFH